MAADESCVCTPTLQPRKHWNPPGYEQPVQVFKADRAYSACRWAVHPRVVKTAANEQTNAQAHICKKTRPRKKKTHARPAIVALLLLLLLSTPSHTATYKRTTMATSSVGLASNHREGSVHRLSVRLNRSHDAYCLGHTELLRAHVLQQGHNLSESNNQLRVALLTCRRGSSHTLEAVRVRWP